MSTDMIPDSYWVWLAEREIEEDEEHIVRGEN